MRLKSFGELGPVASPRGCEVLSIPVTDDVAIGARFYTAGATAPVLLFFHGNGEIVADYEDLAPLYVQKGINFLPVDYRGYGRSTGRPTITAMMKDCHVIFEYTRNWPCAVVAKLRKWLSPAVC